MPTKYSLVNILKIIYQYHSEVTKATISL